MTREPDDLPVIQPGWLALFDRYARRYLKRHFHALRLSRAGWSPRGDLPRDEPPREEWADEPGEPLIVYFNHPSWWDPLLALFLSRELFPGYRSYGPIEGRAVERYGFFRRLGFFGVERGTAAGARRFLDTALALLQQPASALWITPEGRFRDPRERPVELESGLAHLARHLARRLDRGYFVPLALEYPFWEERTPEALMRFGVPLSLAELTGSGGSVADVATITARLAAGLEEAQDALAVEARERREEAFDVLLSGRAGVGGIYDRWRAFRAKMRGERFEREHSRAVRQRR